MNPFLFTSKEILGFVIKSLGPRNPPYNFRAGSNRKKKDNGSSIPAICCDHIHLFI